MSLKQGFLISKNNLIISNILKKYFKYLKQTKIKRKRKFNLE